jgi:hypothetical protein
VIAEAVTARRRLLSVAAAVASLAILAAGCAVPPSARTSSAQSAGVVTTSIASLPSAEASDTSAPATTGSSVATAGGSDSTGLVPIDAAESGDVVRSDLEGYTAGRLVVERLLLKRDYIPRNRSKIGRLTISARRYQDQARAKAQVEVSTRATGVSAVEPAVESGLAGYMYVQGGEQVLVLSDANRTIELRAQPTHGSPTAIRAMLAELAGALLD